MTDKPFRWDNVKSVMSDDKLDLRIVDAVYPSGAIQPALVCRVGGQVRVFHLTEINAQGHHVDCQTVARLEDIVRQP